MKFIPKNKHPQVMQINSLRSNKTTSVENDF